MSAKMRGGIYTGTKKGHTLRINRLAYAVESKSTHTGTNAKSIVPTIAIYSIDSERRVRKMLDRKNIATYILSLNHAKTLLDKGLITIEEYNNYDTILRQKYGIFEGSIFRRNA